MSVGEASQKWLSKAEQEAIKSGCTILIDALFDEWSQDESWEKDAILATRLGKHLPKQYAHNYTPLFLKQFGICVVTVAWKLAQPKRLVLASVAEELAAWAIVKEAKEVIKQESGGEIEAPSAFQAFISGSLKEGHVLSFLDEREADPERSETASTSFAFENWLRPKSGSQTHIPHPYAASLKTGTDVGRAYKRYLSGDERETLAAGIEILIDELFEDFMHTGHRELEDLAGTWLSWHLPPHYLPKYTPAFLKRFSVCIMTVAWKLAQSKPLVLSSVAEELAAWAILTATKQHVELMQEEEDSHVRIREYIFEELFFEDTDFLFLFDQECDGIETTIVGQMMHMTSLAFADWFRPFNDDPSYMAHPYVTDGL